jgi:Na+/H+ antiporter NhaC
MDWIVLLPPVVAIVLVLWTRQVYLSLLTGLWIGTTILAGGNPVLGLGTLVDSIVGVFGDPGNVRIILFSLLVGGLIALVQASGGVAGFVAWVRRKGWGRTPRSAELLAWAVGMVIFVESSITCLIVGTLSRGFFDDMKIAREKLAYYADVTSAPVCMSIPLNGWGAFVLGLLAAQGITAGAVELLARALLFNFFSLFAIVFALALALTGWGFGSMRRAESRAVETGELTRSDSTPMIAEAVAGIGPIRPDDARARDLVVPVGVMVGMIFVGLYVTGNGSLMGGSGSTAVLWATGAAIGVAALMYGIPRPLAGGKALMTPGVVSEWVLKGASGLVGVVALLVLSFALGQVSRELEMGPYVVGVIGDGVPTWWLPALVFLVGAVVSFTLGSSWTTFAILTPIALPLAQGLDIALPLMLGAVLSGGVFGDLSSPLSDTSIISSMAAACDHADHVNTQLPYSLVVAGVAFLAFLVAGILA